MEEIISAITPVLIIIATYMIYTIIINKDKVFKHAVFKVLRDMANANKRDY